MKSDTLKNNVYAKIRRIALFLAVFALCIQSGFAQDAIRIGATMSLSGTLSTQGVPASNGYKLCAADLNIDGGLLGRQVEFIIYDDESSSQTAIRLYEKLIAEDKVDAIMGPYGSTLTEAVAPVTEKHKMVHVSPLAATSSIWEQGREYLFMVLPPAEVFLAGLIDLAQQNGLTKIAIIQQNALFPRAAGDGAAELARNAGLEVVFHITYDSGTEDFSEILKTARDNGAEVLGMAASSLGDFVTVTRQLKEQDINFSMFGTSGAVAEYQQSLGDDANYTYGLSAWEPALDAPGIDDFTKSYKTTFGIEPSFHAAGAYGSCMLFAEAVRTTGNLNQTELRDALLNLKTTTIFGDYAVDERGYQVANSGLFIQWQNGKKVIVWPADVATGEAIFPTPSWSDRK